MYNEKIIDLLGLQKTQGDVGIEIEMETTEPIFVPPPKGWRIEADGSLKNYGAEFVMCKPVKFHKTDQEMLAFKEYIKKEDIQIIKTIRAGIHVHINMQQETLKDVLKLLACYYAFETVLTKFCGDGREGNLFCLRGRDAMGQYESLIKMLKGDDLYCIRTDNLRYSAMNLQSLFKYGTVESRALATTPQLDNVENWVEVLKRLKIFSKKVDSVLDLVNNISGDGPKQVLCNIIGENLLKEIDYPEIEQDIMEDVQNIQMLCFFMSQKGM